MTQQELFADDRYSPPSQRADERKQAGIAQSAETSGDRWQAYAINFVANYLRTHATLHVDDLWAAGLDEPESPRALGAVIQHAGRHGWLESIVTPEGYIASKPSVRSNNQLKPVWRSRLYG